MKKNLLLKYSLLVSCLLIALIVLGKDQDEKRKLIEKSHKVSANSLLRIENKFGKVEINSWNKSDISVEIEIIGRGRNEERAQRILDNIDVDISESGSEISYKTQIPTNKNKNDEGFEINYTVYMPDSNPLSIDNSFGDVTMGNRESDLDLDVSYGSIRVGNVEGFCDIQLSFGSGSIEHIKEGDFKVKYSNNLDIASGTKIDIEEGFSNLEIGEVEELEIESKYGDIEIEKANKVDAEVQFSGFEIEELIGSLELDCSYLKDFSIGRLAKSFTLVDIDGKFGSYEINIEPDLNADIEAEFSFADLKVSSDVDVTFNYQVKESNQAIYKGKIGNGDSDKMIRIDSGYGNVRLRVD